MLKGGRPRPSPTLSGGLRSRTGGLRLFAPGQSAKVALHARDKAHLIHDLERDADVQGTDAAVTDALRKPGIALDLEEDAHSRTETLGVLDHRRDTEIEGQGRAPMRNSAARPLAIGTFVLGHSPL